jgi:hypothetical protein
MLWQSLTPVGTFCDYKHAPIKSRYQRKKTLPCMNQELRRTVYRKQMLYSQFTKCQSNKNWRKFRKQRNFVTKLKRKSMKTYFLEPYMVMVFFFDI